MIPFDDGSARAKRLLSRRKSDYRHFENQRSMHLTSSSFFCADAAAAAAAGAEEGSFFMFSLQECCVGIGGNSTLSWLLLLLLLFLLSLGMTLCFLHTTHTLVLNTYGRPVGGREGLGLRVCVSVDFKTAERGDSLLSADRSVGRRRRRSEVFYKKRRA